MVFQNPDHQILMPNCRSELLLNINQKLSRKEINNKIEYFLPNSTYLACSDKELNVCKYKTLITFNSATQVADVREIIISDCFIGTMGCNKYEKGLELNLRRCQIKNDPSAPN